MLRAIFAAMLRRYHPEEADIKKTHYDTSMMIIIL